MDTTIIINNCEFVLGRDADVQVITEFDQKRDVWKAHAVHFFSTRRMAIATGLGKNCVQAMSALHQETARKVEEFGIPQAQHCRVYVPLSEEAAEVGAGSRADPGNDVDDVISLGSDDEEGPMKTLATVPEQASIPAMAPFGPIQRPPQAASFPSWTGSGRMSCMKADAQRPHGLQETQRVPERSGILCNASPPPPPPPSTAMRLASSVPSHSAVDISPQATSHSPAHTANYTSRSNEPLSTVRALGLESYHLPESISLKSDFVRAGVRCVIINLVWKGHNCVSRGEFSCPMHTSDLKNLACILAVHQSNSPLNIGQHRTLSDMDLSDYMCDDNETCIVASIKQMRQGDRLVPVPSSPSDVARLFTTWGDVPEIDIEVEQMGLPDFGCPPGLAELHNPREKLDLGEADFNTFQGRVDFSGSQERVDLSPRPEL